MSEKPLVLVTGGTGFVGIWVIVYLLREGYRVRTTVRTPSRTDEIKAQLREAGIDEAQISSLNVVTADLLKDDGWAAAVKDVTYVQHVASPFPPALPKHEDELIIPAREGTLRVLRAARDAGSVTRVVLTSSFAAVGHADRPAHAKSDPYTEKDWTNPDSAAPYEKSKTLAERAAWDFIEKEGGKLELAVINPVGIYGPALGTDAGTSLRAIGELLEGNSPGVPRLQINVVDVRDCADMHLRAMTCPQAKGERFLCIGEGGVWMEDLAKMLKKNLGPKARKVPTMVLPNFLIHVVAIFLPIARLILSALGKEKTISNAKAKEILGWQWQYSNEQALMAGADSLIKFGAVKI
jgi:dihydroflavonol-4-reductase